MIPRDWQRIYTELGALVAEFPEGLGGTAPLTLSMHSWVGRACALVEQAGETRDLSTIRIAADNLGSSMRERNSETILAVVFRTLARAEANAPGVVAGSFIPAGNALQAFASIGQLFGAAKNSVFVVDPYLDEKALTVYGTTVPEGVEIRLLADAQAVKSSLKPAIQAWRQQGEDARRPLEARLATPRTLHDRVIIVDASRVWTLTQSLNAFAARSPATILRVEPETAALKIAAYEAIWQAAGPL